MVARVCYFGSQRRTRKAANPARGSLHLGLLSLLAGLLLALHFADPAFAASFDCSQATRRLEKMICAEADLSRLDDDMTARYRSALAELSPAGQVILRQGQRDWLAFMRTHCEARIGKPASSFGGDASECLRVEYTARVRLLDSAARKIGPYLFSRIDKYFLIPSVAGDDGGSRSGFAFAEISYPRIDAPVTPETSRWNDYVKSLMESSKDDASDAGCAPGLGDDCPADTDWGFTFELVSAQPSAISMQYVSWWYWHGAAHGDERSRASNYLLKAGSELQLTDVFNVNLPWRQKLGSIAFSRIKADHPELEWRADSLDDFDFSWLFDQQSLRILIDLRYTLAYVYGYAEITIPWRDLKPYLRPDLPITLNLD